MVLERFARAGPEEAGTSPPNFPAPNPSFTMSILAGLGSQINPFHDCPGFASQSASRGIVLYC